MQKIFDSHLHMIEPGFTLIENKGFLPDYYTVEDYKKELRSLDLEAAGGAVVSGSFQGYDQSYFNEVLPKLGKNFVGVTQVESRVSDEELEDLHQRGIRGIRFNLYRGASVSLKTIEELAMRVYSLFGWHTEFYLDINKLPAELEQLILSLPKASIDHLGMTKTTIGSFKKFLDSGVRIKLTGFGRIEYTKEDLAELIPALHDLNPSGLMFGTDLPSTRARVRFNKEDVGLIQSVLRETQQNRVFYQNAADWYGH